MNLVSLLAERASLHPDRPALVDPSGGRERVIRYGELYRRVSAGSAELHRLGLRRGDTILVFQPVSIELYELLLAAFYGGVRVMLADPSAGSAFLAGCCDMLPPDAFFGSWKAQLLRWTVPALRKIPLALSTGVRIPGSVKWAPHDAAREIEDVPDGEPALITFTSGSTGQPKAAVRTHGFLLAQHKALSQELDFREGETDLITLPVFVLANLESGLTSVLADTDLRSPGSADGGAILRQARKHAVDRCAASPAFFESLLRHPDGLPPFRKVFTGGAPVFPDLLSRLRKALPTAEIVAVYGSTEAEPMAHLHDTTYGEPELARTAAGQGLCAGKPVADIDLRILRDHTGTPLPHLESADFECRLLPAGKEGEIIVSGDHVLKGYLHGRGDEETKIRVGDAVWHRTGDAGYVHPDGTLWLLGRCSAKLPPGNDGTPDYPFAIECALRAAFPTVRTAALGWQGRRTLVIGGEIPPEQREKMEAHARRLGMESVVLLPTIPMDRRHNAKIDYPELRRHLAMAVR